MTSLAFVVGLALTQAPSLALDYQAPEGCPPAASVFDEVKRLRGELVAADDADVRARVRVVAVGSRFSADVETFPGRRTLEADTCQRTIEAVAVVLSLALGTPSAPLPPKPEPPAPAAVPIEPVPVPARLVPFLELVGAARFGVLASPMGLGQLGGGIEWKRLRLGVRLGLAAPSTAEGTDGVANVESWFQGSVSGCGAVIDASARLELCASVDTALLTVTGRSVSNPRQGSVMWVGLLGGAAFRAQLWRGLGAVIDTGIGGALVRPRIYVQQAGTAGILYESPVLTGRLGLGLFWRW